MNNFLGLQEPDLESSSSDDPDEEGQQRKQLINSWSRVKSRDMMKANRMVVFDLEEDLKKLINSDEYKLKNDDPSRAMTFDP